MLFPMFQYEMGDKNTTSVGQNTLNLHSGELGLS